MNTDYLRRRAVTDSAATLFFLAALTGNTDNANAAQTSCSASTPSSVPIVPTEQVIKTPEQKQEEFKKCPYSEANLSELDMRVLASLAQKMDGTPEEIVCTIRKVASHLPPKREPALMERLENIGLSEIASLGVAAIGGLASGVGIEEFKKWQTRKQREKAKIDKENKASSIILK